MNTYNYQLATTLDEAWLNFGPDLPLIPFTDGRPNPFYVERPNSPTLEMTKSLLRPSYLPPKRFLSGYRGNGKSTELQQIAGSSIVQTKFWPVYYSIRDDADINDLDFRDVLLSIGGQLYRTFQQKGGQLPDQLLNNLNSWHGKVETEVQNVLSGRIGGFEVGAGLDAFFANATLKMKLEPTTRSVMRQVFKRNINELIEVIDSITATIRDQEKRIPLLLIDDLDKPSLESTRRIFHENLDYMLQPKCAVVYTVATSLFYVDEFEGIRDQAVFVPSVMVYERGQRDKRNAVGYRAMRLVVRKRMHPKLITNDALDALIYYSGGHFRELSQLVRRAIGHTQTRGDSKITVNDIILGVEEIRSQYYRIINKNDLDFLRQIYKGKQLELNKEQLHRLTQMLVLMEYRDKSHKSWYDVHPALDDIFIDTGER